MRLNLKTLCVISLALFSLTAWGQLDFTDNTNSWMESESNVAPGLDSAQLTWAAWLHQDEQPLNVDYVFTGQTAKGAGAVYYIRIDDSPGSYYLNFWHSWTTTTGNWTSADVSVTGWSHVVISYDRSNATNDPAFYVNNTEYNTYFSETQSAGSPKTGTDTFSIGKRENYGSGRYSGDMYKMAVWSAILDSDERQALTDGVSPLKIRADALELYVPMHAVTALMGSSYIVSAPLTIGSLYPVISTKDPPQVEMDEF